MQYLSPVTGGASLVFDLTDYDASSKLKFVSYDYSCELVPTSIAEQRHSLVVLFTVTSALASALSSGTEFKVSFGTSYDYVASVKKPETIQYEA